MGEAKRKLEAVKSAKVSVLIPVYNMQDWVLEAIGSAVNQTHPVHEILVWDDGSTDLSRAVASSFTDPRVKVMGTKENLGGGAAFQKMIALSEGELIVPFAADDILEETFVARCAVELAEHPEAMMVACHPSFIDADGKPYANPQDARLSIPKPVNLPREQFHAALRQGNRYFGVGMYRASTFVKIGSFDNELKWLSDWDYYLRVLEHGELRVIEEPLCRYRLHPNALSVISQDKLPEQARLVRKVRARRLQ